MQEYIQTLLVRAVMSLVIGVLYFLIFKHFYQNKRTNKKVNLITVPASFIAIMLLIASYVSGWTWIFILIIVFAPYVHFRYLARDRNINRSFLIHVGTLSLIGILASLCVSLILY